MEPNVFDVQLSLFVVDTVTSTGYSSVVTSLKESCPFLNGGSETILPVPVEAPDEIPRVIVNSNDQRYGVSIARRKISFVIKNNAQNNLTLQQMFEDLQARLGLLLVFISGLNWRVNRMGVITNIRYDVAEGETARTWIVENCLREGVYGSGDPLEVFYRLAWRGDVNNLLSNFVVQIGHEPVDAIGHERIINTNFDVNTSPTLITDSNFSREVITRYVTDAIGEIVDLPGQYNLEG